MTFYLRYPQLDQSTEEKTCEVGNGVTSTASGLWLSTFKLGTDRCQVTTGWLLVR